MRDKFFEQIIRDFAIAMANETNTKIYYYTFGGFPTQNKDTLGARISEHERALEEAVKHENFEDAAILRDRIENLRKNFDDYNLKMDDLVTQKEQAVKEQNYERAAEIKKEIEALQNQF